MSIRKGVDLASFQGVPGQWAGAAGKISWAAVKITELGGDGGHYTNPTAGDDWRFLKAQGKARIAYLFGHPGSSPADTVRFFADQLAMLGVDDGDGVCLDLEVTDGRTPGQVSAWAVQVMDGLAKHFGRQPLLYTYLRFAEEGNCAGLGHWPLWIADPSSPAGEPRVPHPWKTWAIHQYAISGSIDRDILGYASAAELRQAIGRPGAKHAKKHPVKVVAKKAAGGVVQAKGKVKKEPVLTGATVAGSAASVAVYVQQHAHLHLTATQMNAALTVIAAVAGVWAAWSARPVRLGVYATLLGTLATAAATFGLHFPYAWVGYQMPAATLVIGLLMRAGVSPKWAPLAAAAERLVQVTSSAATAATGVAPLNVMATPLVADTPAAVT